jgi:hypothetical protein
MFDERIDYYRSVAARLRERAEGTAFSDLRLGYLELARCFERLAARAEHSRYTAQYAAGSAGEDD